jgi:hypothetical protein
MIYYKIQSYISFYVKKIYVNVGSSITKPHMKLLHIAEYCSQFQPNESVASDGQFVEEVKSQLESEHEDLPVGRNGRDDNDLILWFLQDRKFLVQATVSKLAKALVSFIFRPFKCWSVILLFVIVSLSGLPTW